jgi:hypothetical protein
MSSGFAVMERTGIEPVTFGLQTHPISRPHLTPIDRNGMAEPESPILSDVARHGSTAVRSHRARTPGVSMGNASPPARQLTGWAGAHRIETPTHGSES